PFKASPDEEKDFTRLKICENRKRTSRMKSFSRWMLVWLILICEAAMAAGGQMKTAADLIISNAKVWTVDSKLPTAQAVAVFGDRIVAVGSNADIEAWRGTSTQVIDAGGKLLLPGFNDAH